jgi:hypothetical protein
MMIMIIRIYGNKSGQQVNTERFDRLEVATISKSTWNKFETVAACRLCCGRRPAEAGESRGRRRRSERGFIGGGVPSSSLSLPQAGDLHCERSRQITHHMCVQ